MAVKTVLWMGEVANGNVNVVVWFNARPEILKSALVRAVDKGQLEQITGKGASGTFQVSPTRYVWGAIN